jgi:hypothetical protein
MSTATGAEAMPLATTKRWLGPISMDPVAGIVKFVNDGVPGATPT